VTGKQYKLFSIDVKADLHRREQLFRAMERHGLSWEAVRARVQAACVDAATKCVNDLAGEAEVTVAAAKGPRDCAECREARALRCAECRWGED